MVYTWSNGTWGDYEVDRIPESIPHKRKIKEDKNRELKFNVPIPMVAVQRTKDSSFGHVRATLTDDGEVKGMVIDINCYMLFIQDKWDVDNLCKHYELDNATVTCDTIQVIGEDRDTTPDVEIDDIRKVFTGLDVLYNMCYSELKKNARKLDKIIGDRYKYTIYFTCHGIKFELTDYENRLRVVMKIDVLNRKIEFKSNMDFKPYRSYKVPFDYSGKFKRTLNSSFRNLGLTIARFEISKL